MVEKKTLMEDLEEVLAIDGIDMIQFGPVDYGLSLRTPGNPFNILQFKGKIEADADKAIQMAIDAGVHPRIEVLSAEACKEYLDRGILDFCIGSDILMVEEWCLQHGKKFREMVSARPQDKL
jgi:2-keto-3-deoxy-L-rhamnonate aldolase RhmA